MAQWKDVSSYNRSTPVEDRVPTIWEYRTKRLRVVVHRHRGFSPDVWLVSCWHLAIENVPLGNKDLEKAQVEALDFLKTLLQLILAELP